MREAIGACAIASGCRILPAIAGGIVGHVEDIGIGGFLKVEPGDARAGGDRAALSTMVAQPVSTRLVVEPLVSNG